MYLKQLINTNVTVNTMVNSIVTENQLTNLLTTLEGFSELQLVSDECLTAVKPFLCQYIYPPCDGNGSTKFITQEQCINVRDKMCKAEWRLAMTTKFRSLLPVCEEIDIDVNDNDFIWNETEINDISQPLKCHYQFKEFCGVCLPLCDSFSQYPDKVKLIERIVIIIAAVLAVIGAIIVFISAAIRRKEM